MRFDVCSDLLYLLFIFLVCLKFFFVCCGVRARLISFVFYISTRRSMRVVMLLWVCVVLWLLMCFLCVCILCVIYMCVELLKSEEKVLKDV